MSVFFKGKASSAASLMLVAFSIATGSSAEAATWCEITRALPSTMIGFAEVETSMNSSDCKPQALTSAHRRTWDCKTEDGKPATVGLLRVEDGPRAGTVVWYALQPELESLDSIRPCHPQPAYISPVSRFDAGSIAVRDRLSVKQRIGSTDLSLLSFGPIGIAVAGTGYQRHAEQLVEEAVFGFSRPFSPSTSVEIAGRNLVSSSAKDIVDALIARQATLKATSDEYPFLEYQLSPPVGLEGVSEISVKAAGQLATQVIYNVADLASFMTYVELLDDKYGKSTLEAGTGQDKNCKFRLWESGKAYIVSESCSGSKFQITFFNQVATDQIAAYLAKMEEAEKDGKGKKIDLDNF
ncbi:hypothetical protein [Sphingomonas arenae]|uniref:hypothetical protein n=1 Tax=Sphingomonas arenae TaxID=2812555 RepID=UPI001967791C|nr:hypothetical protein [Sphingomonas arenae]